MGRPTQVPQVAAAPWVGSCGGSLKEEVKYGHENHCLVRRVS